MFAGIIKNTGKIKKIFKNKKYLEIHISSNIRFSKRELGSSISCSGVCLSIDKVYSNVVRFYVSKETLNKTTFKHFKDGEIINLEKSLKFGSRISGHFVQGHVDTTSKVKKITRYGKSWYVDFYLSKQFHKYIIPKGSIAINGVSLTISKLIKDGFQIVVIPHTLKLTNLIFLKEKDLVNVEFDVLSKYIKNFLN